MNEVLLHALKKLQYERSDISPFPTHIDFLKWADQVLPLLSYDEKLKIKFKRHVASAHLSNSLRTGDTTANINSAIGLLNQVVSGLEMHQKQPQLVTELLSKPKSLELPQKMTVKWLYEHVPLPFYVWFFGLVIAAFTSGIVFAETPLYSLLKAKISLAKSS